MADLAELSESFGFEWVKKEDIQELANEVKEKGVAAISEIVKKSLDKWRNVPLNIAVTGVSGVGKSSFINALRKLDPDSPLAAKVGVTETTKESMAFAHPDNEMVVFWDLPGVGTPRFTQEKYLEAVGFSKYDFFIIICKDRFTENDLWLAKEIRARNKKFYFARSQIDQAIENDKQDHPKTHSEPAVLAHMRSDCAGQLTANGFENTTIFLISSRKPHLWDFPKLVETFLIDIPGLQKEAMLCTMKINTEAIIKEKSHMLRSRAFKVALASAAVAFIPIPGLSVAADFGLLLGEIAFYKETFGLNSKALDELSQSSGVSRTLFDSRLQPYFWVSATKEGLALILASQGVEHVAEEVVRFVPFVGSLIAGPLSFVTTKLTLESIIRDMEKSAVESIGMTITRASDV